MPRQLHKFCACVLQMEPKLRPLYRIAKRFLLHISNKSLDQLEGKYNKRFYEKNKLLLIEGLEPIVDAFNCGAVLKNLYYIDEKELLLLNKDIDIPMKFLHKIQAKQMQKISRLKRTLSIAALFNRPNLEEFYASESSSNNLTIICDGMQDHVNVGMLIRGAAASGCKQIIVTKGSVNIWSPRLIRASGSSLFHIPVISCCEHENINLSIAPNCEIFVADLPKSHHSKLNDTAIPYDKVDWTRGSNAIIIGNEFQGISEWSRSLVESKKARYTFIPQFSTLSCLSASTSAILIAFEALRQNTAFIKL